jgi:hypothetical protein
MNKKAVIAITSVAVLAVAGAAAIGGVYALFEDKTDVKYHIQSGSLNVTPYLTKRYVKDYANPTGKTSDLDPTIDLSQEGAALFSLGDETSPIYPGLQEGAEIEVKPASGTALDVAMDLSVSLASIQGYELVDGTWKEMADCPLLSQVQVTVAQGTLAAPLEPSVFKLSEVPSAPYAVGSYEAQAALDATFSIRYEFLNLDNALNNLAQSERFSFDFVIDAMQRAL